MSKSCSAAVVFGFSLAILLATAFDASARWRGGGFRNNLAFRNFPLYGGVAASAPYFYPTVYPTAGSVTQVVERAAPVPLPQLTCHHSQETVTVASEDGGTRDIRINRC